MPLEKAKKAIDELNAELQAIPQETGTLERRLEQTKDEIEDAPPKAIKDLLETLQREAKELGVEHPRVTAAINQTDSSFHKSHRDQFTTVKPRTRAFL